MPTSQARLSKCTFDDSVQIRVAAAHISMLHLQSFFKNDLSFLLLYCTALLAAKEQRVGVQ